MWTANEEQGQCHLLGYAVSEGKWFVAKREEVSVFQKRKVRIPKGSLYADMATWDVLLLLLLGLVLSNDSLLR